MPQPEASLSRVTVPPSATAATASASVLYLVGSLPSFAIWATFSGSASAGVPSSASADTGSSVSTMVSANNMEHNFFFISISSSDFPVLLRSAAPRGWSTNKKLPPAKQTGDREKKKVQPAVITRSQRGAGVRPIWLCVPAFRQVCQVYEIVRHGGQTRPPRVFTIARRIDKIKWE